jgi:hypothetical protein
MRERKNELKIKFISKMEAEVNNLGNSKTGHVENNEMCSGYNLKGVDRETSVATAKPGPIHFLIEYLK